MNLAGNTFDATDERVPPEGEIGETASSVLFPDRPPWHAVSSRELAEALGVHLQTLSNWAIRGKGPPATPSHWFRGHRRYYLLGNVRNWLGPSEPIWLQARTFLHRFGLALGSEDEPAVWDFVAISEQTELFPARWPLRVHISVVGGFCSR